MITFSQIPDKMYRNKGDGRWISQKFTNGEFNYYFILETTSLEYTPGYVVSLSIVSPDQIKKHNLDIVQKVWGKDILLNEIKLADRLYLANIDLQIIFKYGSNRQKLLEIVKQKIPDVIKSVNYYMNQIIDGIWIKSPKITRNS